MLLQEIKAGIVSENVKANASLNDLGGERVGLSERKWYNAIILGVSKDDPLTIENDNGQKSTLNRNFIIVATPRCEDAEALEKADWQEYSCGSRAFVEAGIRTAIEKQAAIDGKTIFEVKWETKRDDNDRVIQTRAKTPKKFWTAKVSSLN